MSAKADKLKLDIEEINSLLKEATRQRIKNVLTTELKKLEAEYLQLIKEKNEEITKQIETPAPQKCYQVKLTNYGWDQTNMAVKLYVNIEDACHVNVNTDMVVIYLAKKEKKAWSHVTVIEKMKVQKPDTYDAMNDMLMSFIGKMYKEGDDELKSTINRSWMATQDKFRKSSPR
ncbi:hypothetical protein KM043_001679 [Ampulex compressa]|nr:hypothetical protein KM043_001679 [Ampulex compressa]